MSPGLNKSCDHLCLATAAAGSVRGQHFVAHCPLLGVLLDLTQELSGDSIIPAIYVANRHWQAPIIRPLIAR